MMYSRAGTLVISNLFLLLLVLPAFLTSLGSASMAYGVLISSLLIIAYGLYVNKNKSIFLFKGNVFLILISIPIVILIHTFLIIFLQNQTVDFSRLILSTFLLEITLIAIIFLKNFISKMNQKNFNLCIKYIFIILIMLALLAFFGFFSFGRSGKPIVFFNEPSHFALVFSPFFLWSLYSAKNVLIKFIVLVLVFYIALLIQSLCLMIIVVGACFITLRFINTLIALLILFISYSTFDSALSKMRHFQFHSNFLIERHSTEDYFTKRLPISNLETKLPHSKVADYFVLPINYFDSFIKSTNNGSILVLTSGWERALLNWEDTQGLGLGFQQFGIGDRWGYSTRKLVEIYGMPLCIKDGGSIAAKLIGEFGFFGVLLVLFFIKCTFFKLLEFRRYCINPLDRTNLKYIFYIASVLSFIVSMFIRGVGYFTAESFLFFLGVFSLFINTKLIRDN